MDKLELSCNFFSNQTFWISHMWWEPTNQSFPSLAGGSSLTIDFSFSFFVEFHLKRHHLMTMTNLFTSQVKLLLEIKVFKRGRGDEYLALSTEPKSRWFHGSTNMDILPITILFFCSRLLREWENDLFPSLQTHIVKESAVFWNRNIIYL